MLLNETKDKFKKLMVENELGGKTGEAYMLTKCSAGKSGYSFGLIQMDVSVNKQGRDVLRAALLAAGAQASFVEYISNKVSNASYTLTEEELKMVNDNLFKAAAKNIIDRSFDTFYDSYSKKINGFIATWSKNPRKKLFFSKPFVQLFLLDYNNQFDISNGGKLDVFLSGLDKINTFDILRYLLDTKYAKDKRNQKRDLIRRFCNTIRFSEKEIWVAKDEMIKYQEAAKADKDLLTVLSYIKEVK